TVLPSVGQNAPSESVRTSPQRTKPPLRHSGWRLSGHYPRQRGTISFRLCSPAGGETVSVERLVCPSPTDRNRRSIGIGQAAPMVSGPQSTHPCWHCGPCSVLATDFVTAAPGS